MARLPAALLLLAGLVPAQQPADPLAGLFESGALAELQSLAAERLQADPGDAAASYWSGRALVARASGLLEGGEFAQAQARAWLQGALPCLAAAGPGFPDAGDWALYARFLSGDDPALAGDLERLAQQGSAYAARLRGRLERDRGAPAAAWFARAAELQPDEAGLRLDLAGALGLEGRIDEGLAELEHARRLGADREAWLAVLLGLLPGPENAARLLARLDPLLAEPGAAEDAQLAWYRAWALEQLGRPQEAEAALVAAVAGRSAGSELALARLERRNGRAREAVVRLLPLVAAGDAPALDELVSAADDLAGLYLWEDALAAYAAALDAEPAHLRALANRALTEARAGRPLDAYGVLLERHPERLDFANDAALAALGRGDAAWARELLERAAAGPDGAPGVADARENLAALLLARRPPEAAAALAWLDRLLAAEPGRDRALVLRAQARRLAR